MFQIIEQLSKFFQLLQKVAHKDYFITGILGGLAGTLAMDAFNFVWWKRGKTEALYGHIGGSVLMKPFMTKRKKNFILGQITHIVTGAGLGLPLTYIFKKSGKNKNVFKGACYGLFSWFVLYTLGNRATIFTINPKFSRTHYSGILSNLFFGIAAAKAIVTLSPNLFPETVTYHTLQNKPHPNQTYENYMTTNYYHHESNEELLMN